MKKLLVLLFVVFSMICFSGCDGKATEINGLIKQGYLYVATSTDYAPYEFIDLTKSGDDKYAGSDIELAKAIAEKYGLQLVIKSMSFEATFTSLSSGKVDMIISGITYDESRLGSYTFSSPYYLDGEGDQILLIKKTDSEKFKSLNDLNSPDVKVAAQSGSIQMGLVKEQLPDCNCIEIESLIEATTNLKNGQYDAVAMAKTPALSVVSSSDNDSIEISNYKFEVADSSMYVLLNKNMDDLLEKVNVVCDEVSKGKYQEWLTSASELFENLGNNAGEIIIEDNDEE